MSKPKRSRDVVRYYRPALYGRTVREGEEVPRLRIYHPTRRAHPGVRKILNPAGERVTVRQEDTYYWRRLLLSKDIEEIPEDVVKNVEAAAKKKAEEKVAAAKDARAERAAKAGKSPAKATGKTDKGADAKE